MLVIRHSLKVLRILSISFVLLSVFQAGPVLCASEPVGIFVSSRIRPYIEALDGIQSKTNFTTQVVYLDENPELARHYLKNGGLSAAVAIGPEATKLIYQKEFHIPVKMAIMTLDIEKLVKGTRPCGIDLRVPIAFQISRIAYRLGTGRTLAILYNPQENSDIIAQASKACEEYGLNFIPLAVSGTDEILKKLKPNMNKIEIILFIPDSTVISEKIVTHLTKEALLNGIAVVGYNHFFFEIGALLAFIIDYREVGIKGAELLDDFIRKHSCFMTSPPVKTEWNQKVLRILKERHHDRWADIPGVITDVH